MTPWETSLSDTCHLQRRRSRCQAVWRRDAWRAGPENEWVGTARLAGHGRACGWLSKGQRQMLALPPLPPVALEGGSWAEGPSL